MSSSSDSDSEQEQEQEQEQEPVEWDEVIADLQCLQELQSEACDRLLALEARLTASEPSDAILSMIQQCHELSMADLTEGRGITFGQRLLKTDEMEI